MTNRTRPFTRSTFAIALHASLASLLIGCGALVTDATAQSQQQRAIDYHLHIKPQLDKQAAETAAILARPSNWGPGEIRDAVNYGALAWYQKGKDDYGYVFNKGNIRDLSASLNVDIECSKRKIKCEGKRIVLNEWLVIGSYKNRVHFATATGATQVAAEALVHEQCRKDGTTCTIKDAFEVLPHPRGVSSQRQFTVVR